MKDKNRIGIYISLLVVVMVLIITSFAYAFFTFDTTNIANLAINATIDNSINPVFTSSPTGSISLDANDVNMLPGAGGYISSTQTLTVSLIAGSSDNSVTCSYSFAILNTGDTYTKTEAAGIALEYSLEILQDSNVIVNEANMDSLMATSSAGYDSITSSGSLVTKTYSVTAKIYNLDVEQTITNKHFSAIVTVTGVTCS